MEINAETLLDKFDEKGPELTEIGTRVLDALSKLTGEPTEYSAQDAALAALSDCLQTTLGIRIREGRDRANLERGIGVGILIALPMRQP